MDKPTLLEKLTEARSEWDALLAQIDEADMNRPDFNDEGWSIKDLIAHVSWYERQTAGVFEQKSLLGSDWWNLSLEERNLKILEANRERPLAEVRAEAKQVYEQLLAAIRPLSDEELNDARLYAEMPAEWEPWEVIASNSYDHYPQHVDDVRAYLEKQ